MPTSLPHTCLDAAGVDVGLSPKFTCRGAAPIVQHVYKETVTVFKGATKLGPGPVVANVCKFHPWTEQNRKAVAAHGA